MTNVAGVIVDEDGVETVEQAASSEVRRT